ncbi:hypothetical protein TNCV_4429211 [Trichonephila clavipes]|nr:hypothetical protein TNCV_4429211 [Trichonephila clavipes]
MLQIATRWATVSMVLEKDETRVSMESHERKEFRQQYATPMPLGGPQHLENVRSSPYPGTVSPPLLLSTTLFLRLSVYCSPVVMVMNSYPTCHEFA